MDEEEKIPDQGPEEEKINIKKEILQTVLYIVIVVLAVLFVVNFVAQRTRVSGPSMYPTLEDGDNLIVEKITYRFRDPERFDVIIFPHEEDGEEVYFIKRIIGLPGETIQIDAEGNIYIDGELLEEEYGYETISNAGIASDPITLGEDEYFVMGDNRNNSLDSRYEEVGNILGEDIVGRAWVRIYPFDSAGLVKNIE